MNIFDIILCDLLINEYERKRITAGKEQSYHAYEGKVVQSNFKRIEVSETSNQYELVRSKTEQALSKWLLHLDSQKMYNVPVLRSVLRYPYNFRILKYEKGNYIHPHTDWDHFNFASVTLNLNDDYTGGEFAFMNGKHILRLEQGDALVFPTDHYWVHEVYPVDTGVRYSVNTFISSVHKSERNQISEQISMCHQKHDAIFKL
jgi:predicted 2-oxoglutarate/Fe(II)-dependent dioxygenase YbiX